MIAVDRRAHGLLRGDDRGRADRHQEGARLLDDLAARLHVRRARRRRVRRGDLPPLHARLLQGLPVPRRRQRDPRARRRAGHPQDGRAGAARSRSPSSTFAVATAAIAGMPPLAGFFSKDEILWFALRKQPRRLAHALANAAASPRCSRRSTCSGCCGSRSSARSRMDAKTEHHVHESPPSMTGVLVAAGSALRDRRLPRRPALPRAACCRCPQCRSRARITSRHRSSWSRSRWLSRASRAQRSSIARGAVRADRLRLRFATLHRVLSRQVLHRRAVRDRVRPAAAVDFGACLPADRRPGAARRLAARPGGARRSAPPERSARVQTGSLHLYALLRARRSIACAGLDLAPCLTPPC